METCMIDRETLKGIEANVKACLNEKLFNIGIISEEMYLLARENIFKTIKKGVN